MSGPAANAISTAEPANGLYHASTETGVTGGGVLEAPLCFDGPCPDNRLVAGGTAARRFSFNVPVDNHGMNVRFLRDPFDSTKGTYGTWDLNY
jgi:hypothetical protein